MFQILETTVFFNWLKTDVKQFFQLLKDPECSQNDPHIIEFSDLDILDGLEATLFALRVTKRNKLELKEIIIRIEDMKTCLKSYTNESKPSRPHMFVCGTPINNNPVLLEVIN